MHSGRQDSNLCSLQLHKNHTHTHTSRWANQGQPLWLDTIRHGRLGISRLEILAGQEPKEIVEPLRLVAWIVVGNDAQRNIFPQFISGLTTLNSYRSYIPIKEVCSKSRTETVEGLHNSTEEKHWSQFVRWLKWRYNALMNYSIWSSKFLDTHWSI